MARRARVQVNQLSCAADQLQPKPLFRKHFASKPAQVNQLQRAACHLQLEPSFTKVSYGEVQGSFDPPLYSKEWLHVIPTFRGRNRWIARGVDRATVGDVALVDASARNDLRSVAIREADYSLALQRLRVSQAHERSLNEKLASLHRGEYLVEKGLLFARLLIADIDSIAQWFSSTPPHIFAPLRELHGQILSDLFDLKHEVNALSSVLRVRLNQHLGADTIRHMAVMHKLAIPIRKEHHKRYAMKKSIRRIWKQTRSPGDYSAAALDENDEFYDFTEASVRGDREDLHALEIHEDVQRTLALDRDPARWIATSFNMWFEHVMQQRWLSLRRVIYPLIKFANSDETTPNQKRMRKLAHDSFRQRLDEQEFRLPKPYGQDGFHGQDLFTLVRELQWIRNYRIERFPESIGKDEIRLARDFYGHMRGTLYSRAHNEDVHRYWRMNYKRFARQSGHDKDQVQGMEGGGGRGEGVGHGEVVGGGIESSPRGNQTMPYNTNTARKPPEAHVSRKAESRRVSSIESSEFLATAEQPQREAPALVMAFQASQAFQRAHAKPVSHASSSLSTDRPTEPQLAALRPSEPAIHDPFAARERPEAQASCPNVAPRASYKGTYKAASKVKRTGTRSATPPIAGKISKARKVGVGTRLANLLHFQKRSQR
ncbi:hypothetical protein DPSP01_001829 [Paraphaeosphaeria sporulosa]